MYTRLTNRLPFCCMIFTVSSRSKTSEVYTQNQSEEFHILTQSWQTNYHSDVKHIFTVHFKQDRGQVVMLASSQEHQDED